MKAAVISQNTARKTAMIVIHYTVDGCKRSNTRHCQLGASGKWRGYILDTHKRELELVEVASQLLKHAIDAMNAELGNKAKKATEYTPELFFAWDASADNEDDYNAHIAHERQTARQVIERLNDEGDKLRVQVEARRAAEREKRAKIA